MNSHYKPLLVLLLALTVVMVGCGKPSQKLYGHLKREYAQNESFPDEATVVKLAEEYGGEFSKYRDGIWFVDW